MIVEKLRKQKISSLVKDERWDEVIWFLKGYLEVLKDQPVKADTEFETLWNLAIKEGGISQIKKFFDELEQMALE